MVDWRLFALGSAAFAALTAVFGKLGVSEMNSNVATFYRTVIILVLAGAVVTGNREWQSPASLPWRGLLFLLLSGCATGLSWLCYYRALQLGPASKVAPIDKLSVVLVVVFGVLFLKETLSWKAALGTVLIGLGAVLTTF